MLLVVVGCYSPFAIEAMDTHLKQMPRLAVQKSSDACNVFNGRRGCMTPVIDPKAREDQHGAGAGDTPLRILILARGGYHHGGYHHGHHDAVLAMYICVFRSK